MEVRQVTRIGDFDLTQHLADDDFDVLIIDGHVLSAVHRLDFTEQVLLQGFFTADAQEILRHQSTVHQGVTGAHAVALVHAVVLTLRDAVFDFGAGVTTDDDGTLAALTLTEVDDAVDFGHDRGILRRTSFEELGNAGQTTGDVDWNHPFRGGRGDQSVPPSMTSPSLTRRVAFSGIG